MIFHKPAGNFREAFLLGNGRIGAAVFGGIAQERILLNESSMWSGSPSYHYPADVYRILPEIQRLVFEERYHEAQELYEREFLAYQPMPMDGANCALLPYGSAQVLGELDLFFFQFASGCGQEWYPFQYHRELNLEEATATTTYRSFWQSNTPGSDKECVYTRQAIVSRDGECAAIRLSASRAGSIGFNAQLRRPERFRVESAGPNGLLMTGCLSDGTGGDGVLYACLLRVMAVGGTVEQDGTVLSVRGAEEAVLYITAATDMKCFGSRNCEDPVQTVFNDMEKACGLGWEYLLKENVRWQKKMFRRNLFSLGELQRDVEELPLDRRLARVAAGERDDGLLVLLYQFGRYLLLRGSRRGGMPLGIMGIWGEEIQAPFNGDYHLNAQQITYWAAECCNMSEFHEPYLHMAEALQKPGTDVAKAFYHSRGWVAHVFTNPWLFALPGGEVHWGATITGGAWLCIHLWEHFLYTQDRAFLERAYPVMKGAAEFLEDRLVMDPALGKLVIFPGNSPENIFLDEQNRPTSLCQGTTYDMEITRALFQACTEAARILEKDMPFAARLEKTIGELAETRLGSDGCIMEWQREFREMKPYHRHISPLWGAFPGCSITPEDTPELAEGCIKLIKKRTFTGHTWAMVHRLGVLARLHQGNWADDILNQILRYGVFSNLLSHVYFSIQDETEPETDLQNPFQYDNIFEIDGNTGLPAVVAELLLQSFRRRPVQTERGEKELWVLELLRSLPDAWQDGYITGLRARGSLEVDIFWKEGKLLRTEIRGEPGQSCIVSWNDKEIVVNLESGRAVLTGDQFGLNSV